MYSIFILGLLGLNTLFVHGLLQDYACLPNNVLVASSQSPAMFDMSQAQAVICGETRTCVLSKGSKCVNKGQYMSGVSTAGSAGVVPICCQYSPPVKNHKEDRCQVIVVNTHNGTYTPAVNLPSIGGGGGSGTPSGGRAGGGNAADHSSGVASQNFVKSIDATSAVPGQLPQTFSVLACTPVCEGTSTTRRPTTTPPRHNTNEEKTEEEVPPAAPRHSLFGRGEGGGGHCFSGDMMVNTPQGSKRMDSIGAGDEVLVSWIDFKPIYKPIEWFYHKDPEMEADFITVTTQSHRTLQLSPNHLIPTVPCSNVQLQKLAVSYFTNTQSIFSRRLKIGDCIAILNHNELRADKISSVKLVRKKGIFSPITSHGTIIINDVYVSCFSSFENHFIQQAVHSILIGSRNVIGDLWSKVFGKTVMTREDKGIPLPLQILLKLAGYVLPSNVFSM